MDVRSSNRPAVSALGEYEGYSFPEYDGRRRYSFYLPMDDGVKIAVDYYIPTKNGVEETRPLPVLLHCTPYNRVTYGRFVKAFNRNAKPDIGDDEIILGDNGFEGMFDLTRFGYVMAICDVRGTGASFGVRVTTNSRREAEDDKAVCEWLAAQPFCDGKVGTFGFSYHGGTQLGLMSLCPKGLTAAFIGSTDFDKYDGWVRGGIPRAFGSEPDTVYGDTPEEIEETVNRIVRDTVPVDSDPDKVLLKEAVYQHVDNGRQIPIMRDLNWRNSYLPATDSEHWKTVGNSYYLDGLNKSGCAVYIVGGTYDVFRKETAALWTNLTVPKKLLVGPWYHTSPKLSCRWDTEALRWFDYWLKGIDNGIMEDAPVTFRTASYNFRRKAIFGSGTGFWREEEDWPVQAGSRSIMYFRPEDYLSETPTAQSGSVPYAAVYGCVTGPEAVYTTKPSGPFGMPVRPGGEELAMDSCGLTFTGEPLKNPKTVIGHPEAEIVFSLEDPGWMTEKYDMDFFVSLIDYYPATGEGFLVTTGQLRASMRAESGEAHYNTTGLPWHRCNTGDEEYLECGKEYRLVIDLMPTSYVFRKGHCIRVTVTNSMANAYYLGKAQYEADPNVKTPVIRIYTGGDSPSLIRLPDIYDEGQ